MTALFACVLFSGCGTILAKRTEIKLYNYTDNVKLKVDGKVEQPEQVLLASKEFIGNAGSINYYGAGVTMDRKHARTLVLDKNGKTVEIKMKPKVWGFVVVADMLFLCGGPLGLALDAATGNWKHLKPTYVDVTYALGESKHKSLGKLKRQYKRKLNKGK